VVLVFLETGMKSSEISTLTTAHVDISDPYRPELWIKHSGNKAKKDLRVALPPQFVEVYQRYLAQYRIEDAMFPYTYCISRRNFFGGKQLRVYQG